MINHLPQDPRALQEVSPIRHARLYALLGDLHRGACLGSITVLRDGTYRHFREKYGMTRRQLDQAIDDACRFGLATVTSKMEVFLTMGERMKRAC